MSSSRRWRARGEQGITTVLVALLLLPMLTFVAIGVDTSTWYGRAGELQRAADSAALAGTVWMPNLVKATSVATDSLARNGIVDGVGNIEVAIRQGATPTSLSVTVTDRRAARMMPGVFSRNQAIRRSAEAEYYLPLPLGSPLNFFGGDASKTAVPDTTTITVTWPNPYSSTSWPPAGPFGCNVGTSSTQGLGRWASATSYSATGFSGTTQCRWAPTTATTSPAPTLQMPTNVPCNRLQTPTGSLGRWETAVTLPIYNGLARYTSGTGNRQCTWSVAGTQPPDAATRAPANAPCNVTGNTLDGSWNLVLTKTTFVPAALLNAPQCQWLPSIVTTVTSTPNPIPADRDPGFWAQVEGPGTVAAYGDAFSTACATSASCTSTQSAQWRPSGYWYVIQAPAAGSSPITVSIFDAAFRRNGVITQDTGDYNLGAASTATNPDFLTEYRVYQQTNPLDVNQRIPLGAASSPNQANNSCWWSMGQAPAFDLVWRPLCTFTPTPGARYLLNVKTRDTGTIHGAGLNGYAVQALASGSVQPSLYAYSDMGMFNNGSGTFYLAEVAPTYAGKVLDVDLWDPGDVSSGTATIYPLMPSRTAPRPVQPVPATCTYTASPDPNVAHTTTAAWGSTGVQYATPRPSDRTTQCAIDTAPTGSAQRFNDEWLHIRIQIPTDYTCTPGVNPETTPGSCWWGISYSFSSQPYDVTTWKARIEGDPVHLTG
jgi:hypothetical protein